LVTAILIGFVVFIAGLVLFFIARRILRLALKVAFAVALIFMLLGGATLGWWQGWFSSSSSARRPSTQTNQRANTNRRAPSR
jgi:FtsH-binding integral membrane protein